MKRRLLAISLAICMIISILPMTALAAESTYSDTSGHWAESAIERWSDYGVLQGSDGLFRPDDSISRAELAAIINRIMGFPELGEKPFTDTAGKWYEADVNAVALQGIYIVAKGQALGDQPLTREGAVEMLYRAFVRREVTFAFEKLEAFADQDEVSPEYSVAVSSFRQLRFISGYSDGSFHPKEVFTRAQVVTILNNMIGIYITEPGVYDIPDDATVCVAVPGVTLNGKSIHYVSILPAAAEGMTVLEQSPGFGVVWGAHNYRDPEHVRIDGPVVGGILVLPATTHYAKIQTTIDHEFAGGTGRNGDPYIIETEAQLRRLDSYLSEDYKNYHFALGRDITLSSEWTPIGSKAGANGTDISYDDMFWGALDGGGHAIKNLNINYKGSGIRLFGLFSYLAGSVSNLSVEGSITVESTAGSGAEEENGIFTGAITGILAMSGGLIENCAADVTIDVKGPGRNVAGGICGHLSAMAVKNCSVTGSIKVSSSATLEGQNANAGGIAGTSGSASAKIADCLADVNVVASGGYYSHAGGICGAAGSWSSLERCFASGTVHAEGSKWQNSAGGIAGQMEEISAAMRECGSAADVSAVGNPGYFNAAGGLVGSAYTNCIITNCYSAGTVKVDGPASAGGLVGRAECRITTSYTTTKITAPEAFGNPEVNGMVGTIRDFIVVKGCGVFNVADPHFISYDAEHDINVLNPVGGRSLSEVSTYKELGSLTSQYGGANWNFDTVWTFASSGTYSYPILRGIAEEVQLG